MSSLMAVCRERALEVTLPKKRNSCANSVFEAVVCHGFVCDSTLAQSGRLRKDIGPRLGLLVLLVGVTTDVLPKGSGISSGSFEFQNFGFEFSCMLRYGGHFTWFYSLKGVG